MYPLMSKQEVLSYLPTIVQYGVSERARKPDGFLSVYVSGKDINKLMYPGKNHSYAVEREQFIKRHLAQYNKQKTIRRKLSLIAWGFNPN
jgi:hypothetical protein